ncbi:MAG: ComEC family competence protein [Candidatus Tectomicrobia bacterium]|uniref:ComEC family competence protein n=1 Tax=Tectimicrobiota bacterium TaxID=2528274 RepID=A0A932I0I5_UNCTE|nr:ComEC family competence protein [Candidatus Tectomicrobia bacterium]
MHPLDFLTLGYVGSLLAEAVPAGTGQAGAALAAALLLGLGALAARMSEGRLPGLGKAALPLLLAASGALAGAAVPAFHRWMVPSHHLLKNLPYGRINLIGHLAQPPERSEGRGGRRPRLTVEVERLVVRGVDVPARGAARITLSSALERPLEVGDRVLIRGVRLYPPRRYLNPDGFDYREFMRLLGVHATGFAHPRSVARLESREKAAWRRALFGVRERMRAHFRSALPEDAAGLLEVMTIGVREELDPEIRAAFRLTGTAHLLAISGLHVGFIAAFFYFVLRRTSRRLPPAWFPYRPVVLTPDKAASLGTIAMIVLFALLSGARVSTVRAAIMGVAYLTARVLERKGGALHSVLLAALFILLIEPAFIWDAGFQLSFVAVTAIILSVRRGPLAQPEGEGGRKPRWRLWLKEFAWVQLVVSTAVAPLTAWHFQEAHPVGLAANFFLIPIASLAVPLAFLFALAGALLPQALEILLLPFDALLALLARAMILLTRWGAALPGGSWTVPPPSRELMLGFFLAFLAALGARRAAWRRAGWAGAAAAVLWMLLPSPLSFGGRAAATGRTALLLPDGGRADIFLLRLPDGRGFAVDAGGASGGFDTWRNVVAPLLRREGGTSWEALFAFSPATAPLAARELGSAMRLARTFGPDFLESEGRRAPGVTGAPRVAWETSSPPARLRLLRWPGGASAFEVTHGEARWLLFAGRVSGAFDADTLPGRGYDVIRLPESLLERRDVLDWLSRARPPAIIASPWRGGGPPPRDWRETRARQHALGVYRPWRRGMARLETAGGPIGRGGEMVRYEMAASWPAASPGRWTAWRPRGPLSADETDASEEDE